MERLKASQLELDGGSIISNVIETEKNKKVKFEHDHVKTKKDNDERENSYGKNLVLECDYEAKEERLKCKTEHENYNTRFRANVFLKCRNRHCERKISEVIKKIDSIRKVEEYFQDKHGEKWKLIDIEAREGFSNCT